MTLEEAIKQLTDVRNSGPYKLEISAYAKDSYWTLKAFHPNGYAFSCTTHGADFVELVEKAMEKLKYKKDDK